MGINPISDAAVEVVKSTVGKAVDGLIAKFLPPTMTDAEKETVRVEAQKLVVEELKANVELEKAFAADRDSARQREIKTGDSWTPRGLATLIISGWFFIQWFLLTHVVATEMREIILRGLGTLDLAVGLVLGYYFGSSSGSAAKTALLGKKNT